MKVLELKGYKSIRALNAFNALVLGLKFLPAYEHLNFEVFLQSIQDMSEDQQRVILTEAAMFVELEEAELQAIICFCEDTNGVPYGPENLKSLTAKQIVEIVVAVCLEISKIKIDLITEEEKKK